MTHEGLLRRTAADVRLLAILTSQEQSIRMKKDAAFSAFARHSTALMVQAERDGVRPRGLDALRAEVDRLIEEEDGRPAVGPLSSWPPSLELKARPWPAWRD